MHVGNIIKRKLLYSSTPKKLCTDPKGSTASTICSIRFLQQMNTAEPEPALHEMKLNHVSDGNPSSHHIYFVHTEQSLCLLWTGCGHVWVHFHTYPLLVEKKFGLKGWEKILQMKEAVKVIFERVWFSNNKAVPSVIIYITNSVLTIKEKLFGDHWFCQL